MVNWGVKIKLGQRRLDESLYILPRRYREEHFSSLDVEFPIVIVMLFWEPVSFVAVEAATKEKVFSL